MKALIYLAERKTDLGPMFTRFPAVAYAEARSLDEFRKEIVDADLLIVWTSDYSPQIASATRELARRLKWIQFATSGIDGALKNGGFPDGVIVTNVAGLRAPNLAEHAFLLLFFLAREMRRFEAARARREWARAEASGRVTSFRGCTALIVGMGAIGQAIARRARAFDMRAIAVSRAYRADDVVDSVYSREDAAVAFARADVVFICLPSDPGTRGFVDRVKLGAMKSTAYLINVARGDIVVEAALIDACRRRSIAGAGIDVAAVEPLPSDSPLWTLDNVVITPHVAGTGRDETHILAAMIAENLELYLAGAPLLHRVAS